MEVEIIDNGRDGQIEADDGSLACRSPEAGGIIITMAVIHISEGDAARDFAGLMAQVRAGAEVIIERDSTPIAVLHTPSPPRRSIQDCIAMLPVDSRATVDEEFARDVEGIVALHREQLDPPAWD